LIVTVKRHDLICIKIGDEIEIDIINICLIEVKDLEANETILADFSALAESFKLKVSD
jgi:hypothetical protein